MIKQKLILPTSIILGCLILGGFIYASQINKNKNEDCLGPGVLQKEIVFNKNLECQKLRISALSVVESFDVYAPPGSNFSSLLELFYSPITNSCLVSFTHSNGEYRDAARQYFKLYDLFSSELLISKEALPKNEEERTTESFWDNTSEEYRAEVDIYK